MTVPHTQTLAGGPLLPLLCSLRITRAALHQTPVHQRDPPPHQLSFTWPYRLVCHFFRSTGSEASPSSTRECACRTRAASWRSSGRAPAFSPFTVIRWSRERERPTMRVPDGNAGERAPISPSALSGGEASSRLSSARPSDKTNIGEMVGESWGAREGAPLCFLEKGGVRFSEGSARCSAERERGRRGPTSIGVRGVSKAGGRNSGASAAGARALILARSRLWTGSSSLDLDRPRRSPLAGGRGDFVGDTGSSGGGDGGKGGSSVTSLSCSSARSSTERLDLRCSLYVLAVSRRWENDWSNAGDARSDGGAGGERGEKDVVTVSGDRSEASGADGRSGGLISFWPRRPIDLSSCSRSSRNVSYSAGSIVSVYRSANLRAGRDSEQQARSRRGAGEQQASINGRRGVARCEANDSPRGKPERPGAAHGAAGGGDDSV